MKTLNWRNHVLLLTALALFAIGAAAFAWWTDSGGNSAALLLSLVTGVVSAIGAAKSAEMAASMEQRMASTERMHGVRELVRSLSSANAAYYTEKAHLEAMMSTNRALAIRYGAFGGSRYKLVESRIAQEATELEEVRAVLQTIPGDPTEVQALDDAQLATFQITLDAINVTLDAGNANLLREALRYEEEERLARTASPGP